MSPPPLLFLSLNSELLSALQALVTSMICLWALRLGGFLALRIRWYGADPRLDKVMPTPGVFFVYWMMQGVWVCVSSIPVHLLNDMSHQPEAGILDFLGMLSLPLWTSLLMASDSPTLNSLDLFLLPGFFLWMVGFLIETVADYHKFYFRLTNYNRKEFVKTGLWAYSRHPNYLGEIILWWGVFITAYSGLNSFAHFTVISPMFVTYLLSMVSGVSHHPVHSFFLPHQSSHSLSAK